MGYSRSRVTLEKMLPHLERIQAGEECTWQTSDPHKLAYKIREALYIAKLHKDQFPQLARASEQFQIQLQLPDKVTAKKLAATGPVIQVNGDQETRTESLRIEGPQSASTVIEAWLAHNAKQIHFPEARMDHSDLEALYNWSKKRDLIMFVSGSGLTIQPATADLEEYGWSPDE